MSTRSEVCTEAYTQLSEVQALQAAFDATLVVAIQSGDFSVIEALSAELATKLTALEAFLSNLDKNEKLEAAFNLTEQYNSQVDILRRNGLLERFSSDREGIKDAFGNEYPVPTLAEVQARFEANIDFFLQKKSQGFGQLRLVPFALPIPSIIYNVAEAMKRHHAERMFFGMKRNGNDPVEPLDPYDLNTNQPIFLDNDWLRRSEVVYYPQQFDQSDHGGKPKDQLLLDDRARSASDVTAIPGWNIRLFEDECNIPRAGQGKIIGNRPQIETGKNAADYLRDFQAAQANPTSPYYGEVVTTIEDWLMHLLVTLEQTNQVIAINHYADPSVGVYQLGMYNKVTDDASHCYWDRSDKQLALRSVYPYGNNTSEKGVRFGVRV